MSSAAVEGQTPDDLFERPWLPSMAKRASRAIADAFETQGGDYARITLRMRECGSILEFACYRVGDDEEITRKLVRCSWCRIRLCFLCERARARKRHLNLWQLLKAWFAKRPRDQAILLTLTIKSVCDSELLDAIDRFMTSLRRLTRCRRFKGAVLAWYRTLEVTRDADTGLWHPHIHLLLVVPPSYFRRSTDGYITQEEWADLWRKFARLDYDPVVDIRALKGVGRGPLTDIGRKTLAEVTKYCTKPGDLVQFDEDGQPYPVDPEVLKTLYDALHGRRLVGMSGPLRKLAKELRLNDPDAEDADLSAAEALPKDAVYLGREFYRWHAALGDYVWVPRTAWFTQREEREMPS
jgi:plasmid rolling circle replication initiator protein Rep